MNWCDFLDRLESRMLAAGRPGRAQEVLAKAEARRLALDILNQAERGRATVAEEEATRGAQYDNGSA